MTNTDKKWKLIRSKPVFESKWLSVLENDYELPDGKEAKGYYHLSRPNYVLVIAIDKNNNIIVEKNYRRGVDDSVYELPAGWVEKNEIVEQAAKRELSEETGYSAEIEIIGKIYPQPGFSSMLAYIALARIDDSQKGVQTLDNDEDIKYELINLSKIKEMVTKGEIKDMGFLAALQIASL